jgi:hypothetical protein
MIGAPFFVYYSGFSKLFNFSSAKTFDITEKRMGLTYKILQNLALHNRITKEKAVNELLFH